MPMQFKTMTFGLFVILFADLWSWSLAISTWKYEVRKGYKLIYILRWNMIV